MDPARGQSCPSGQRRHPAALSEDHVLSPDENSFHTPATPTTRGRKQWSPRSIPPRAAKKPQLHIRMLIGWSSWSQRAARVATRANGEVPPNPGRISSPPRVRNHSTSVQLQLTRNENEDPPGRYRSAGGRNPNLTGWLLIGGGSWSQRAARVAPLANVDIPPHSTRITFYPRMITTSILLQLQLPGDENSGRPGRYRPAR